MQPEDVVWQGLLGRLDMAACPYGYSPPSKRDGLGDGDLRDCDELSWSAELVPRWVRHRLRNSPM